MKNQEKIQEILNQESIKIQLEEKGISKENILEQLALFEKGDIFVNLQNSCSLEKGINSINPSDFDYLLDLQSKAQSNSRISKFVPASGAATRMFQSMLYIYSNYQSMSLNELKQMAVYDKQAQDLLYFIENIENFPFYEDFLEIYKRNHGLIDYNNENLDIILLLSIFIDSENLNYSKLPKGLIKFHKCKSEVYTAFESHLYEAIEIAQSTNNSCKIHFTIAEQNRNEITSHIQEVINKIENQKSTNQSRENLKFELSYSIQENSTDTIATDLDHIPFLDENNKLLFRPGGHGSLIHNLNNLEADIVFIKNIDNILPNQYNSESVYYNKLITGLLIDLQNKLFDFYSKFTASEINVNLQNSAINFLNREFHVIFDHDFEKLDFDQKNKYLFNLINRPIRVCGMVKNQGEPGGGPFWVKQHNKHISLQIIESSQINMANHIQNAIFSSSTFFNPVFIVCGLKDAQNNNFNLLDFVDKDMSFISKKSYKGNEILALEHPGLWNGSMAEWNTVFVELPLAIFTPVKTVNDLLKHKKLISK